MISSSCGTNLEDFIWRGTLSDVKAGRSLWGILREKSLALIL